MSGLTYRASGVDVARAEDALARVKARIAASGRPEVLGGVGSFAGLFRFDGSRDSVLVATTDGVGTKLALIRLLDRHEVAGTDLVHQNVNDLLCVGAEPLFFLDYYATSFLDPGVFERVVGAIADACAAHGCALLGGETSEMPGMYAPGTYDLAGFLVGAVARDRMLSADAVEPGDALVGLPSSGLHTNGYSLARAIVARMSERAGIEQLEMLRRPLPELHGGTLGEALLVPHRSYLADLRVLRGAARVRSVAHITGGGWEGNLPRALPAGLGGVVHRAAWRVPPLFTLLGDAGDVAVDERWSTWNMGIGLVAVVAAEDLRGALRALPGAISIGRVERAAGTARVRFA